MTHAPEHVSPEHPATGASAAPPVAARFVPWIPIRSLSPRHRDRIATHLLALPDRDRYLRFGYIAGDAQIQRYVDSLDFDRDEVFGVFNRRLSLIAMAHLAVTRQGAGAARAAEFGVSVSAAYRGRGYGARLFEHACLHARNRGLDSLFIHALSENTVMLRIARQAGARVERAGGEAEAYLRLPQDTMASRMEQWVGEGAAEIDYRFKQQSRLVGNLLGALGEARASGGKARGKDDPHG